MSVYFSNPLTPGSELFTPELFPLMSTISMQGNSSGKINRGDVRDSRQWVSFAGPFDFEALRAVYEFADTIRFVDVAGRYVDVPGAFTRIEFTDSRGEPAMSISSSGGVTPRFKRMNRRWWKRWNKKQRDRVFFDNPYFPSWEPLVRSGRRVLASESLEGALFPILASEAARGNLGRFRRAPRDRYVLNHSMDFAALRDEFDFGPGIHLNDETNSMTFDAEDGTGIAFTVVGKRGHGTKFSVGMRARWWDSQNPNATERRPFLNPWFS